MKRRMLVAYGTRSGSTAEVAEAIGRALTESGKKENGGEGLSAAQRILLACGALSTLLYAVMNVVVPAQWEGYDPASQVISELSAIGAPTRSLWLALCVPYSLLVTAFGCGVWRSSRGNRPLRVVGALLIAYGVTGFVWPFFPMHLRGAAPGLTDSMHIVLSGATCLLYLLALGFGAAAFGQRFRLYSIATGIVLIATGVLTGLDGARLAANLPTPWIGVWERLSIGAAMLWIAVLAWAVLNRHRRKPIDAHRRPDRGPPPG
jgi:hypothetical protein